MMAIFSEFVEEIVEVFMDDFSVYGKTFMDCLANMDKILTRCAEVYLVLNWEKCHFIVKQGIVLEGPIRRTREGGSEWEPINFFLEGDGNSNKMNTASNTRLRLTTQVGQAHVATGVPLDLGTNTQPSDPRTQRNTEPRVYRLKDRCGEPEMGGVNASR
jgi:hypothetical protein